MATLTSTVVGKLALLPAMAECSLIHIVTSMSCHISLTLAIPRRVRGNLSVVLVCVSLLGKDVEHFKVFLSHL